MNAPLRGLYVITPSGLSLPDLLVCSEAALRGGATLLQYRAKALVAAERAAAARALCALSHRYAARFIVNDDLALALAVDADGVHLGVADGDLYAARQQLGSGRLLGASCYADLGRARTAAAAGADYLAFGAVYPSSSKPQAPCAPHALFRQCRDELGIPLCAIGGITLDRAPALLTAGADLLAVISDLFSAPDVALRAAAYESLFAERKSHEFT